MKLKVARLSSLLAFFFFTTALANQEQDFASFKQKMMPSVGHKTTVTGKLASAKLGWLVRVDGWGVYVYATRDSDIAKSNALNRFNDQTVRAVGTLRYSAGSQTTRTDVASVPEHFYFDVAELAITAAHPIAEITFREMRFRTPPLVELYFDIVLRNDQIDARWFVLPSNLGPGQKRKGGVDSAEVFMPRGQGRVVVGHFLGNGGFYALLLPAHAQVRLRMFPISYWGTPPDQMEIEVITATRVTVGAKSAPESNSTKESEDASKWFGVNALSSVNADITEDAIDTKRMVHSHHTSDNKELPINIETDERVRVPVIISQTPR